MLNFSRTNGYVASVLVALSFGGAAAHATTLSSSDYTKFVDPSSAEVGTGLNLTALHNSSIGTVSETGGSIKIGSGTGYFAAPFVGGSQVTSPYLVTYGGQANTFTIAGGTNYFAFNWGSVDANNLLTVTTGTGSTASTYTLYGSQFDTEYLVTGSATNSVTKNQANSKDPLSDAFIAITGLTDITKVTLSTKLNSFEVSNVSISPVPLPGSLVMFGSALIGLTALGSRRRSI